MQAYPSRTPARAASVLLAGIPHSSSHLNPKTSPPRMTREAARPARRRSPEWSGGREPLAGIPRSALPSRARPDTGPSLATGHEARHWLRVTPRSVRRTLARGRHAPGPRSSHAQDRRSRLQPCASADAPMAPMNRAAVHAGQQLSGRDAACAEPVRLLGRNLRPCITLPGCGVPPNAQ